MNAPEHRELPRFREANYETIRAEIAGGRPLAELIHDHGPYDTLRALGAASIHYEVADQIERRVGPWLADETERRRRDRNLQIWIFAASALAMWCITQPAGGVLFRYGWWIGFLSQPLWFAETWRRRQWGMFGLAFVYSLMWAQGIYQHFFHGSLF